MEKEEITEGNKLIAEFDKVRVPDGHYIEMRSHLRYYCDSFDKFGTVIGFVCAVELQYHKDWNRLMPVVQKILSLYYEAFPDNTDFKRMILENEELPCEEYMCVVGLPMGTPIEEVWKAVVEFIVWYNKQTAK